MQSIKANLGRVMHPHTVLTSQYLLDTSFLMNKKSKKGEGKGKKKKFTEHLIIEFNNPTP